MPPPDPTPHPRGVHLLLFDVHQPWLAHFLRLGQHLAVVLVQLGVNHLHLVSGGGREGVGVGG
jgi:hypothetical protein